MLALQVLNLLLLCTYHVNIFVFYFKTGHLLPHAQRIDRRQETRACGRSASQLARPGKSGALE